MIGLTVSDDVLGVGQGVRQDVVEGGGAHMDLPALHHRPCWQLLRPCSGLSPGPALQLARD